MGSIADADADRISSDTGRCWFHAAWFGSGGRYGNDSASVG